MSISISYATDYADWTISDYLADWSAYFGDVNHREGEVVEGGDNTGGFYPGYLSGTQYAIGSTESAAGLIVDGSLAYSLFVSPSHTMYGTIDSIQLGTGLSATGPYTLESVEVTFEGLSDYLVSALSEGHEGIVHQIIYGLMSGDASALESALDTILADYGVSTANTFDEVAAALSAADTLVAEATAVGVSDIVEDYAIAA